jgi:hypothetical protein
MAYTGYGITITFASGFCAEIIGTTPPAPSREAIDVSHTQSPDGAKQFIMSDLVDYGELAVELNYDPSAVPPIHDDFEATVINMPDGSTHSFMGALQNYAPTGPLDDRMTATATIKVTGKITVA